MTNYTSFERADLIKEIERLKAELLNFSYEAVSALNDEFRIPNHVKSHVDSEWIIDTLGSGIGHIYLNAKSTIKIIEKYP